MKAIQRKIVLLVPISLGFLNDIENPSRLGTQGPLIIILGLGFVGYGLGFIMCGAGGRDGGSKVVDEFKLPYISLSPMPLVLTIPYLPRPNRRRYCIKLNPS